MQEKLPRQRQEDPAEEARKAPGESRALPGLKNEVNYVRTRKGSAFFLSLCDSNEKYANTNDE